MPETMTALSDAERATSRSARASEVKRITTPVGPATLAALEYITDNGAKNQKDAVASAIWLEEKVLRLLRSGGSVIFRYPDGRETELQPR